MEAKEYIIVILLAISITLAVITGAIYWKQIYNEKHAKKYLFLMGGSGCGKTTLAKKLESADSAKYRNIVEYSTREKRKNEVNGEDYHFISESDFISLHKQKAFCEEVLFQFSPGVYGAKFEDLEDSKWNVLVVSIEGFLSAMKHIKSYDIACIVNIINDVPTDIDRDGRDKDAEENVNLGVISSLSANTGNLLDDSARISVLNNDNKKVTCKYVPLKLSELKKIRNKNKELLEYFNNICP